jgi:Uma2 family endonuclease
VARWLCVWRGGRQKTYSLFRNRSSTWTTYLIPDILVHPAAIPRAKVRGGNALLVVEVADTSLRYDLSTKAPIYAAYGVREYWVINAVTLAMMVHRKPSGKIYEAVEEAAPGETLTRSARLNSIWTEFRPSCSDIVNGCRGSRSALKK